MIILAVCQFLFAQAFKTWNDKVSQEINAVQTETDRQQVLSQLASECRAQFRRVQPGETEDIRGMWLTQIQKNQVELYQTTGREIFRFLEELLSPSSQDFSLNSGRSWLEALLTDLNRQQREIEDYLQARTGLSTLEHLETKWRNATNRLQDIETQKGFLGVFNNNKQKCQQFRDEAIQIFNDLKKLIQQNFDYQLYQTALEVNQSLVKFVQSLITEASQINTLLKSVDASYQRQIEDLERLNPDEITGEALFSPNDIAACYREFIPEQEEKSILIVMSKKVLKEEFSFEESLAYLLIKITDREVKSDGEWFYYLVSSQIDNQLMEKGINITIDKRFAAQKVNALQGVVNRFLEKYPFTAANNRMQQIISESKPLLPLIKDGYFYEDQSNKSEIIAFKQADDSYSHQFNELLTNQIGIQRSVLKAVQNDSEIVIVNEYAAFPLRLIQGLDKMREHYDRECQQNRARIHNDYQQIFSEIIPPEARLMKEMQNVFYACLAFGILKRQEYCYLYESHDNFLDRRDSIPLSLIWSEALEQITKSGRISESLKQERDDIIDNIKTNLSLWESQYLPQLQSFGKEVMGLSKEDPNFSEVSIILGKSVTLDRDATEGILIKLRNQIARLVKEAQANPIKNQKILQPQRQVNGEEGLIDSDVIDANLEEQAKK